MNMKTRVSEKGTLVLFIINLFCKLIFSKHPCFIFCLVNVFLVMRILRIFRIKFINKSEMLKVLTFMKQVANGLQVEGNFGTAHVYRSSLNAIIAYSGKVDFTFDEVSPEWLKGFEVYLRSRGCSGNTVST